MRSAMSTGAVASPLAVGPAPTYSAIPTHQSRFPPGPAAQLRLAPFAEVQMPYDPMLVAPMRAELTSLGAMELLTSGEVDSWFDEKSGSGLLIINSVCGCAAGQARPSIGLALAHANRPDRVATVFAGQDVEATGRAREHFADFPPSSPSMVLFSEGEIVHFVPRHRIESRGAEEIAQELTEAFDKYCAPSEA